MSTSGPNKAKIAKRVIEVLEFFDEEHPKATVMDIVRRFDRPQSSTSELLSSLVEVGLLYKDPYSRSYCPTPRAAMLGCVAQPRMVRDGQLIALIDRLSAQTGLGVGVFGMVGLEVQIYNWRADQRPARKAAPCIISGGQKDRLSDSAAGLLLLSTIHQPRRESMLRRLNAEAAADRKFSFPEMAAKLQQCRDDGNVTGMAGFKSNAEVTAILLPGMPENQPMAIGLVYDAAERIDRSALLVTVTDAVAHCAERQLVETDNVQPLFDPAMPAASTSRLPAAMVSAAPTHIWSNSQPTMPRAQPVR